MQPAAARAKARWRGSELASWKRCTTETRARSARLVSPARQGAEKWLDADYALMNFAPARMSLRPGEGPPHIRLDRAVEFLIGDRL